MAGSGTSGRRLGIGASRQRAGPWSRAGFRCERPALTGTTGVLGKWKYLRSHDVMMGLGNGFEGQVWVYKPVGWQAP